MTPALLNEVIHVAAASGGDQLAEQFRHLFGKAQVSFLPIPPVAQVLKPLSQQQKPQLPKEQPPKVEFYAPAELLQSLMQIHHSDFMVGANQKMQPFNKGSFGYPENINPIDIESGIYFRL